MKTVCLTIILAASLLAHAGAAGPVKAFVLAGDESMLRQGSIDGVSRGPGAKPVDAAEAAGKPGTLHNLVKENPRYNALGNPQDGWAVRDDVALYDAHPLTNNTRHPAQRDCRLGFNRGGALWQAGGCRCWLQPAKTGSSESSSARLRDLRHAPLPAHGVAQGQHGEREWRAYATNAVGRLGDTSVVPELCNLLAKRGPNPIMLKCLSDLGDARALDPAINALRLLLDRGDETDGWSPGFRSPAYNVVALAKKTGRLDDSKVVALLDELRMEPQWGRLLREERAFIEALA